MRTTAWHIEIKRLLSGSIDDRATIRVNDTMECWIVFDNRWKWYNSGANFQTLPIHYARSKPEKLFINLSKLKAKGAIALHLFPQFAIFFSTPHVSRAVIRSSSFVFKDVDLFISVRRKRDPCLFIRPKKKTAEFIRSNVINRHVKRKKRLRRILFFIFILSASFKIFNYFLCTSIKKTVIEYCMHRKISM